MSLDAAYAALSKVTQRADNSAGDGPVRILRRRQNDAAKAHSGECDGLLQQVIVNDMASINVDAELVRQGGMLQQQEKMVELSNGCICCTLGRTC